MGSLVRERVCSRTQVTGRFQRADSVMASMISYIRLFVVCLALRRMALTTPSGEKRNGLLWRCRCGFPVPEATPLRLFIRQSCAHVKSPGDSSPHSDYQPISFFSRALTFLASRPILVALRSNLAMCWLSGLRCLRWR